MMTPPLCQPITCVIVLRLRFLGSCAGVAFVSVNGDYLRVSRIHFPTFDPFHSLSAFALQAVVCDDGGRWRC